jgi:hypothetical protein
MAEELVTHWQCLLGWDREEPLGEVFYLTLGNWNDQWYGTQDQVEKAWRDHPNFHEYKVLLWLPYSEYQVLCVELGSVYDNQEAWKEMIRTRTSTALKETKSKERPPDKGPLWWEAKFVTGDDMMKAIRALSTIPMPTKTK